MFHLRLSHLRFIVFLSFPPRSKAANFRKCKLIIIHKCFHIDSLLDLEDLMAMHMVCVANVILNEISHGFYQ